MPASEATRPCDGTVLIWEEWVTHFSEGTCPECAKLDGTWFRQGDGPQPPLHVNCRCQRKAVSWECLSRSPDHGPAGSGRGGPGSQSRPAGGGGSSNQ